MPPLSHTHAIALVINTRSRKAETFFFQVLDHLIDAGKEVDLFPVRRSQDLVPAVKNAIRRGNKIVIIGGGDGTVSAMIGHFVHTDVILGILPLGTANSFIRSLGIPDDPKSAIDTILHGKVSRIDVGKLNNRYFANAVSFGYTTQVAEKLSRGLKKHLGMLAYAVEGVRQALSMQQFSLEVTHGEKRETFSTYQVIVANGSFYGPTELAPKATVNSSKLVLLAMKDMGRSALLWAWIKSFGSKSLAHHSSYQLVADSFTLKPKPHQTVTVDGELYKAPTLTFSIEPEAVKVMVPREFKKVKRR